MSIPRGIPHKRQTLILKVKYYVDVFRDSLKKVYNNKISKCQQHCPKPTTAASTQFTTAMPVTSQEVSVNATESVTSQPQLEATMSTSLKILNRNDSNQSAAASEEDTP